MILDPPSNLFAKYIQSRVVLESILGSESTTLAMIKRSCYFLGLGVHRPTLRRVKSVALIQDRIARLKFSVSETQKSCCAKITLRAPHFCRCFSSPPVYIRIRIDSR